MSSHIQGCKCWGLRRCVWGASCRTSWKTPGGLESTGPGWSRQEDASLSAWVSEGKWVGGGQGGGRMWMRRGRGRGKLQVRNSVCISAAKEPADCSVIHTGKQAQNHIIHFISGNTLCTLSAASQTQKVRTKSRQRSSSVHLPCRVFVPFTATSSLCVWLYF